MRLMGSMVALVCSLASTAGAKAPDTVRADARAILDKIISIPSSAGRGQVPAVAMYLADRFRAAGFPSDDIHILPTGETASLVMRYRGDGTGGRPILVLAHMDVVTAKPEDWERDPFKLVEENGFFYARGVSDDKAMAAIFTDTMNRQKQGGYKPARGAKPPRKKVVGLLPPGGGGISGSVVLCAPAPPPPPPAPPLPPGGTGPVP